MSESEPLLSTRQLNPNSLPRCAQISCKLTKMVGGFALSLQAGKSDGTSAAKVPQFVDFLFLTESEILIFWSHLARSASKTCHGRNSIVAKLCPKRQQIKSAYLRWTKNRQSPIISLTLSL